MKGERIWYVYEHYKADTGDVFYVGIGSHKRGKKYKKYYRVSENAKRSNYWKNIAKKHGVGFDIISDNLTKEEACQLEIECIKIYGRENLCNLTKGGEHPSDLTKEQRDAKNAATKARWADPVFRARVIAKMKAVASTPEARRLRSENMKRHANKAEVKQKIVQDMKVRWLDPRRIESVSQKMKAAWQDPSYRDPLLAKRRALAQSKNV